MMGNDNINKLKTASLSLLTEGTTILIFFSTKIIIYTVHDSETGIHDNMYCNKHKKVNYKITTCEYTQSINYTSNVFDNNNNNTGELWLRPHHSLVCFNFELLW